MTPGAGALKNKILGELVTYLWIRRAGRIHTKHFKNIFSDHVCVFYLEHPYISFTDNLLRARDYPSHKQVVADPEF